MSLVINDKAGPCQKCRGTGTYSWGAIVNGRATKSGPCYGCKGTGRQTDGDIKRNTTYAKYYGAYQC